MFPDVGSPSLNTSPAPKPEDNGDRRGLLAVDGNCLIARGVFALPESIKAPSGIPVNGTYGFFSMLINAIRDYRPDAVVVAFDPKGGSFRRDILPTYKQGRVELPKSFQAQLDLSKEILAILGIPSLQVGRYEADDVLASIATDAAAKGYQVTVVTTDRDVLQLVSDPAVRVLLLRRGISDAVLYDEKAVRTRTGVSPEDYVAFAALRGDPSDNLQGVRGVGEKTAAILVNRYHTVEDLFSHTAELSPRIGAALRQAESDVRRNVALSTLVDDLGVGTLGPISPRAWTDNPIVRAKLAETGLAALVPRLTQLAQLPRLNQLAEHSSTGVLGGAGAEVQVAGWSQPFARPAALCLVSCGAAKRPVASRAADLYVSPLFKAARAYAERHAEKWLILSAKHGLLDPESVIEPYDVSLDALSPAERRRWAEDIVEAVLRQVPQGSIVTLLAGGEYAADLGPRLSARGYDVDLPLASLSIGKRLKWLTALAAPPADKQLESFYDLTSELARGLGGSLLFSACSGEMRWPRRGLYLFSDDNERRTGAFGSRVVRVGTHAVSRGSRSTLWGRLRAHRGLVGGSGAHRSSVFRLHVGAALLAKTERRELYPNWARAKAVDRAVWEAEAPLEREVSSYIGAMRLLYIAVPDEPSPTSDRGYLERNAIALLARVGAQRDHPSENWLGRWSPQERIRRSGLWNLDYVDDFTDDRFLDVFAEYVDRTIRHVELPARSIAPKGWWKGSLGLARQRTLFEIPEA